MSGEPDRQGRKVCVYGYFHHPRFTFSNLKLVEANAAAGNDEVPANDLVVAPYREKIAIDLHPGRSKSLDNLIATVVPDDVVGAKVFERTRQTVPFHIAMGGEHTDLHVRDFTRDHV